MIKYQGIKPIVTAALPDKIFLVIPLILFAILLSHKSLKRTPGYCKGNKLNTVCMSAVVLISTLVPLLFGSLFQIIKGLLLVVLFTYASVCDYRERKVPDCVSLMIFLVGLIDVKASDIIFRFAASAAIFGILFLFACLNKEKFGGADVKFCSACVFLVGIMNGLSAIIIGLILSVVCTLIRNGIIKSKDKSMPLIPYLSIGFMTVILIGGF